MRKEKAILLVGFNNWGKTTLLHTLFGRHYFMSNRSYDIDKINAKFTVQPDSNDDINKPNYVKKLKDKIIRSPNKGKNLFAAFCPTREPKNNSVEILRSSPLSSYKNIYLFLLKHKWDHHAELRANDIKKYLRKINNTRFITIDADANISDINKRVEAKRKQIIKELLKIFP